MTRNLDAPRGNLSDFQKNNVKLIVISRALMHANKIFA